ncbi:hypothetical protein M011DRAFT_473515 [Sporormia fimetaria CBS 119925]|uniref:CBM-cenC domain-containing protein n=1 Tax=Sporormia fimetaria CBS 119925 TaxID=1340428 RepID=A0A6A6VNS8_9PLEO|nr:hypothetical protein M011DRAFT_473515 [Sporormia fimetaria CBS 119925]
MRSRLRRFIQLESRVYTDFSDFRPQFYLGINWDDAYDVPIFLVLVLVLILTFLILRLLLVSQETIINDPSGSHNGNSYVCVVSLDANEAFVSFDTGLNLEPAQRYSVKLWIKSASTAESRCTVSVLIGSQTVASSSGGVPDEWIQLSGAYTSEVGDQSPTLSMRVMCPARVEVPTPIRRYKRQAPGDGVLLDDLEMTEDDGSTTTSEPVSQGTADTGSTMSETGVTTTITASTTASITPTSPLSCVPTLSDGTFEASGPSGSTQDWSSEIGFDAVTLEGTGDLWWANVRYEGFSALHQEGYGYTAYTGKSTATTYDIKYLHPITLCAGTTYHVSAWVRNNRRNSAWTEGCRVTAFLDDKKAWSDRVGFSDWNYRYLDGTITPTTDTTTAEFFIRVECRDQQQPDTHRPRGVKLDDIAIVPAGSYTFPPEASVTPTSTYYVPEATPTQFFPYPSACLSVGFSGRQKTCIMHGEQFPDPGFELCTYDGWQYPDTSTVDTTLTGVFPEAAHTGEKGLRVVLNESGGEFIFQSWGGLSACPERSYVYSLWLKQDMENACTVEITWGTWPYPTRGVFGTHIPPADGTWGRFEGTIDATGDEEPQVQGGELKFHVKCSSGGLESAVYIDDLSFKEVETERNFGYVTCDQCGIPLEA